MSPIYISKTQRQGQRDKERHRDRDSNRGRETKTQTERQRHIDRFVLPDALAYCIYLALGSGFQLSWKVHDSSFGTSVQILWKRNGLGGATEPVNQLATTGSQPTLSSSRKKRKTPSQIGEAET